MTRRRIRPFLLLTVLPFAAACGGPSGAGAVAPWPGHYGLPPQNGSWQHRSSFGGGDQSVGGDGNGFHYFIDSSGTSWTGGG